MAEEQQAPNQGNLNVRNPAEDDVSIVQLTGKGGTTPEDSLRPTPALARLLARATRINEIARKNGYDRFNFDISFRSSRFNHYGERCRMGTSGV
jgi:hypothetical protein